MINYKKSLLSVAAAAAIATTSLSAGYLPITSASNDYEWVIFGVSGLKTDGAIATVPGAFTIGTGVKLALTDVTVDEIQASGMTVAAGDGGDLVQLKAIVDADVEIRIDTTNLDGSDVAYLNSDPVRTIYVKTSLNGAPNFAVSYKSVLEGKTLEYAIGGGAAYSLVLDSQNVFDNPILGVEISGVAAVAGNELKSLTTTDSVMDYDFADNPPVFSEWVAASHRNAIGAGELRVYTYDAPNAKWEIYDSRNVPGTNDFEEIIAGKGYWARLDIDGAHVNSAEAEAGLVLGTPSLTTTNYTNAGLTEGWNFIAFDGVNSEIRNSTVGMLLTTSTTAGGTWTVTDSSGNHTITITGIGAPDASDVVAKAVNHAVTSAKLNGTVPSTFELKAFPTDTVGQIVLIANKKFSIKDDGADQLDAATTLNGAVLLDPVTLIDTVNGADVENANGVMTKYGEFAMVIQPLIGAGTADALSNNPASVQLSSDAATTTYNYAGAANIAAVQGILDAHGDVSAIEIDLSIGSDATTESLLLTSDNQFSLRDHTFSRSLEYVTQGATNSDLDISVGNVTDIDIAFGSDANTQAGVIDTAGGALTFSADDDGAGNIIIVSDTALQAKFTALEHTADLLQVSTSSSDLAKGAVKNVYSLSYLSKIANRNFDTIDLNEIADEDGDAYRIDFDTGYGTTVTGTVVTFATAGTDGWADAGDNDVSGTDDYIEFLDALVLQLNTDLAAAGMTATASHDSAANIADALITVDGPDVIDITYTQTANGGGAEAAATATTADLGYIVSGYSGDLATDLKYNYIKTPDYVMNGPLYTMKDNGMALKALVTGTTKLSDGSVSWESVDLTRNPSEWLDSQDYDLFDTSANAGYWAYLIPDLSGNPLGIASATLSTEYAHHFDEVSGTGVGTTINEFSGNLEVLVNGLNPVDNYLSARVTATIGGETIELDQDGLDPKKFTGSVSVHEANGVNKDTAYGVIINVADGLGNNLTDSVTTDFDNVKPPKPTVTMVAGELTISSTDPEVTGFYVFGGTPPEVGTEAAKTAYVAGAGGTVGVVCDTLTASAWDDNTGGITVVAVDGDGTINTGNISDTESIAFMPILLNRILISDIQNTGDSIESTTGGELYDTSCTNTGAISIDTGVSITSITDDKVAKVAYTSQGQKADNDVPITAYVADANGIVAAVTYPTAYVGTDIFLEIDGQVHGYQLPTRAALEALGNSSTTPVDVETPGAANNPKVGISL